MTTELIHGDALDMLPKLAGRDFTGIGIDADRVAQAERYMADDLTAKTA